MLSFFIKKSELGKVRTFLSPQDFGSLGIVDYKDPLNCPDLFYLTFVFLFFDTTFVKRTKKRRSVTYYPTFEIWTIS